jgi:very-short-patch-repair endonuclease/predicted transcriptional regulator of viral defense system
MVDESATTTRVPGLLLAELAGRQHGVASRRQLLHLGLKPSSIGLWTESGHLHRLHRGVYAVGCRAVGEDGSRLAAVLACGPDAALASISAAEHQRLVHTTGSRPIHVVVPRRSKVAPGGVLLHRPRAFDRRDLIVVRNVPVTSPTRTIFDAASDVGLGLLRIMLERAEHREELDRVRLAELLDDARGRRGLGALKELLGFESIPLSRTRSVLERIVLSVCRTHRLPIPGVNVPLLDYEVDFFWPAARFVVEADGGHHIGGRRDRDNERDVALARAGILVRRYTFEALKDRDAVGREIHEILVERLQPSSGADLIQHAG